MKIGLFGGSFNPIHNGHLAIVREVLRKKIVDEVWIMPCKKHPFNKELASSEDRINMIKLAIKNIRNAKVNDIEIKMRGKSYTHITLKKLKKKYKHNYEFFFIIGSDILYEIKKWHNYKKLLKEIEFILFRRKGYKIKKVKGMKIAFLINRQSSGISSTEIRKRIKKGKSVREFVPHAVGKYIGKKGLYI